MKPRLAVWAMLLAAFAQASCAQGTAFYFDVGNDTDYEWTADSSFSGPQRLDVYESLNRYVRGGCWCVGCKYDSASENCTVPIVFTPLLVGNLSVNDVNLRFTRSNTLAEVAYGSSFRKSDGGCWRVHYIGGGITGNQPIPSGHVCTGTDYEYRPGFTMPPTDDAVNDAVYRLLNETLDTTPRNGEMDLIFNQNRTFQAAGRIGVQTLWGPMRMRLVVWS
jgi:hypothetical protein